jgi:hypothetical protein
VLLDYYWRFIALGLRKHIENDSFCSFSQWCLDGFKGCLVYRCIMKRCRSSSNMDAARLLLEKLLPLDFENFLKMSVSVHFLSNGLMDSNHIWYTDVS